MPSKSKAQQRFMGMVHALNKGEMKPSDASPAVKKAAKSMDTKSTEKYASTKHKGKPEKVNKEWIVKTIKELTNTEMEACGYTTSAVDPNYKLKSPGGTGKVDKKLKELAEKMGGCLCEKCWKGYKIHPTQKTKELFGKKYPNCVKAESVNEAYGLNEMKMSEIDKLIKSKIKDVARKDRKRGMELMNLYKKHWIEFMLKTKDLLSTETLGVSLVNPKGMKKQTKDLGESILNEMDYRGFIKYMNDFYGPKGVYPDKKKRTLGQKEIGMAYSVLLKKKPNFEIGFDSTDREMLRDILIKLRKLDPDYSKKESVKESINENRDFEKLYKLFSKKDYFHLKSSIKRMLGNWEIALKKGDKGAQKYKKQDIIKAVTAQNKANAKRTYDELVKAIKKKDIRALKSKLRHNQPYSIAIFNQVTGKKLPKTTRDIHSFLDNEFMNESVNEGKGVEKIMKMADDHSFGKLGGRTVDAMTANLFKQVYEKANDKQKEKINKMNEKQLYVFMAKLWSRFGKQVRL
jgi:hypothetical protein